MLNYTLITVLTSSSKEKTKSSQTSPRVELPINTLEYAVISLDYAKTTLNQNKNIKINMEDETDLKKMFPYPATSLN